MNSNPIGMFDSGIGGMTVFKEVKEALANESIIYLGDNINFPYGAKSKETIQELTQKGLDFCQEKGAKLLVIACGTATSQALDTVKDKMKVPVIGIIEPTIEYIARKESLHTVGVIATAGTIRSGGWEKALKIARPDIQVKTNACPLLAPLAEEGWVENEVARLAIHEYVKEMHDVDALILGCTHYPLFEKVLREELGSEIELINTGKLVAQKVKEILTEQDQLGSQPADFSKQYQIFVTDHTPSLEQMTNLIFQNEKMKEQIQKIRLS
mgnify:CR=1 FL=1